MQMTRPKCSQDRLIRQRVNNSTKKFIRIIQKLPNWAETGGKLFFNIAKILIVIIVVLLLSHWMFFDSTEGTILQPFEISGIKNVSGSTVADLFNFELNNILEINSQELMSAPIKKSAHRVAFTPKISARPQDNLTTLMSSYSDMSSFASRTPSAEKSISELGSIGVGGTSLSVGQLVLSLKEIAGRQPSTITGSLQKYGPTLSMVAIWNDNTEKQKTV
jgi:hypothetical protein